MCPSHVALGTRRSQRGFLAPRACASVRAAKRSRFVPSNRGVRPRGVAEGTRVTVGIDGSCVDLDAAVTHVRGVVSARGMTTATPRLAVHDGHRWWCSHDGTRRARYLGLMRTRSSGSPCGVDGQELGALCGDSRGALRWTSSRPCPARYGAITSRHRAIFIVPVVSSLANAPCPRNRNR